MSSFFGETKKERNFKTAERLIGIIGALSGIIVLIDTYVLKSRLVSSLRLPESIPTGLVALLLLAFSVTIFLLGRRKPYVEVSHATIAEQWSQDYVHDEIKRVNDGSRIRVFNNWLGERAHLVSFLEDRLTRGNQKFSVQVFLQDPIAGKEIVAARMRLRRATFESALDEIKYSKIELEQLKNRVDQYWTSKGENRKLSLEIRYFDFMPFGTLYQIGEKAIFTGVMIPTDSTFLAPMTCLRNDKSHSWRILTENLDIAWDNSIPVFPKSTE